ncbi:unnamed protein product [Rhodiola kirilowii]
MSTPSWLYFNPNPCSHLSDYKLIHGLTGYTNLNTCLRASPSGSISVRIDQEKLVNRCVFESDKHKSECGEKRRLLMCLICGKSMCCEHSVLHAQIEIGHVVMVDVERSELYCCLCSDQVYDPEFDTVLMRKHLKFRAKIGIQIGDERIEKMRFGKRRRLGINRSEKQLGFVNDLRSKSYFPFGLRGLNNLGNTCFMNSVLQALLHAAPLRNYFLGDRHNREKCRKMSVEKLCLPCDVDAIFTAMYSGDRSPYSPAQFLYSWWQHSSNLATYEQQDAHEFFISMLDLIHEKEVKKSCRHPKDNSECVCIAHVVFSGLLRSDVTCATCGFTSTTYDPCVDISLDLDTSRCSSKSKTMKSNESSSISTLLGCLDLFTKPEKLGSDQKLYCQTCDEMRESVKQMSIRRLPAVLCLHIKRFEHSHIKKMSRKVDRHVQFPFSLDMSPYLSSSIVRNRFGNRIYAFEGDEAEVVSTEYDVFAVVTHSGMLESGHYITYLCLRNQWYKCDDAWVTEVDERVVRASQCYLVYYVQRGFHHAASEDLGCVPMSPHRDSFQPIAGCC